MAPRNRTSSADDPGVNGNTTDSASSELITPRKRKEILYNGYYYDVTDWIQRHPGGKLISFYTEPGEDSTMAVQQFHNRSSNKVMAIMKSLPHRPATQQDDVLVPETRQRHQALTDDFTKLYTDLQREGYFKPSLAHVIYRVSEILTLALLGLYLIIRFESIFLKSIAIILCSMSQARCGWLMHEALHNSLTGSGKWDRFLGKVIMGVGIGMSGSWWSSQHNRHHAMPQRLSRDVDLETMPLLAFNAKVIRNPQHGKSFLIRHQAKLFILIDTFLVGLMWKFYLHPRYILHKKQYSEFIFFAVHYVFAYYVGFVPYLLSVWIGSMYLLGNFSLSHTHLPVTDQKLHWVEYSLLHTTDIDQSWYIDWWMGYLNHQIEHHLFPTMPQFRQSRIKHRVKALAAKYNIPYQCCSYTEAVIKTFSNLDHVADHFKDH